MEKQIKFTVWLSERAGQIIAKDATDRWASRKATSEEILEFYASLTDEDRKRILDTSRLGHRQTNFSWITRAAGKVKGKNGKE